MKEYKIEKQDIHVKVFSMTKTFYAETLKEALEQARVEKDWENVKLKTNFKENYKILEVDN